MEIETEKSKNVIPSKMKLKYKISCPYDWDFRHDFENGAPLATTSVPTISHLSTIFQGNCFPKSASAIEFKPVSQPVPYLHYSGMYASPCTAQIWRQRVIPLSNSAVHTSSCIFSGNFECCRRKERNRCIFHVSQEATWDDKPRIRRSRTAFSVVQLQILEHEFTNTHYPCLKSRERIAVETELSETRVQVWFSNRRAKWRREHKIESLSHIY